ncbi:hypothetical protein, partial [Rubricoccus marinus]
MGWEQRGARAYYYAKERTPEGRVRSRYLGSGEAPREAADLAAQSCEWDRALSRAGCGAFPQIDR